MKRGYFHLLFISGFWISFLQYYEFAWQLYRAGLITSPITSELMGRGLHHGYAGFIFMVIGYIAFTWKDYNTITNRWKKFPETFQERILKYMNTS